MWHDHQPAKDLVGSDFYNTNFFTQGALDAIAAHDAAKPIWLHMMHQAVHTGAARAPPSWESWHTDPDYISALHVLDSGVGNLTNAMKAAGIWDNTLFLLAADNGGDCGLMSGYASNYPLLGRKCTSWDGGTRTAAFVAGGLVSASLHGTTNAGLFHLVDWYPTLCFLAGVDAADDWIDDAGVEHPIDGVNIWPSLSSGGTLTSGHEWLPTTERSIIWDQRQQAITNSSGRKDDNYERASNDNSSSSSTEEHMWKLITIETATNRFHKNGSQYADMSHPCVNSSLPPGARPSWWPPSWCTVCTPEQPCLFDVPSLSRQCSRICAHNCNGTMIIIE